jgi:hypothetical protein
MKIPSDIKDRLMAEFDHLQVGSTDPRIEFLRFVQLGINAENDRLHQEHKKGRASLMESHFPNVYLEMIEEGHKYYLLAKMGEHHYGFTLKFTHPPEGALVMRLDPYHKPSHNDRLEAYHQENRYPQKTAVIA